MATTPPRYWGVDREGDGWVFTYICHESEDVYSTREAALEALVDFLAEANQQLMIAADED